MKYLSIIVPVYNVEPYLRKCVESLLAQDLNPDEYEIILVDDGSTDGCPAICDEYAQALPPSGGSRKGANIKVIHQPNGGLSAARNTGIRAAKGDYVCFVDSDDYLEPNVFAGLMAQVERDDLDVLRFDYQNVRITPDGDYEVFQPNKHPHRVDHRTDVVDGETYLNERMGYECYAVQFIVRRSLLVGECSEISNQQSAIINSRNGDQSAIFFTPGLHFEDVDWTPRVLLAAKRVNSTDTVVYNYLVRQGSITKSTDVSRMHKNMEDKLINISSLIHLSTSYPMCHWLARMRNILTVSVLNELSIHSISEACIEIRHLRSIEALPLYPMRHDATYNRRARLIRMNPYFYCIINNIVGHIR